MEGSRNLDGMITEENLECHIFRKGASLENMGWEKSFLGKQKTSAESLRQDLGLEVDIKFLN